MSVQTPNVVTRIPPTIPKTTPSPRPMSLLGTCLPAGTYCSTDDHARDRPDHHVPHGRCRQRVDGGPGDRSDRQHEHRRGPGDPRRHPTPRHELGRHDLGEAGTGQSSDRSAERRERSTTLGVGLQNSGLAVAHVASLFDPAAALTPALFSVWHNVKTATLTPRRCPSAPQSGPRSHR